MGLSRAKSARATVIAAPWSPRNPFTSTTSPGRSRSAEGEMPSGTQPTPAVLMNSLSALPLGTTLVSPVTICTPAAAAAWAMLSTTRRRVSIGNPSSKMKPQVR